MTIKKILVVDDEVSITRLLKLNLERTGRYAVQEVNSSANAVETALQFHPDLVLMDVMMPEMTGGDVVAAMREEPDLRRVPVVFLTAAVRKEELGATTGYIGGRLYITKPLNIQEVIVVIEKVLGGLTPSSGPSPR